MIIVVIIARTSIAKFHINYYIKKLLFFVDRYIGQTVVCVGNIHQTIVDCFVLEAFREYCDDLRDHMSDNTQNRPKSELRKIRLSVM